MCRTAPAHIVSLFFLAITASLFGEAIPVQITKDGLERGGQPYFIKGVGGDTRLPEMKAAGVNSFRTWSHDHLATQLPEAEKHGLTVCAGIWLEPECDWFSYRKPEHCERQFKRVREIVQKHKDAHLDTDKAWHLTHFLLTGEAWGGEEPLCNAVLGGSGIGEVDVGYGPARYLTPAQVDEVAAALADISPRELWGRFDTGRAQDADIYPSGWEGNDEDREYIFDSFGDLKTFFADAAKAREAMVLYIN